VANLQRFDKPTYFGQPATFEKGVTFLGDDADLNIGGDISLTGILTARSNISLLGVISIPFTAAGNMNTAGWGVVLGSTARQVEIPTTTTGVLPYGIILAQATSGDQVDVATAGIISAISKGDGTTIVAGDEVTLNEEGKVIKSVTDGTWIIGRAIEGSQTDDFAILIDIMRAQHKT